MQGGSGCVDNSCAPVITPWMSLERRKHQFSPDDYCVRYRLRAPEIPLHPIPYTVTYFVGPRVHRDLHSVSNRTVPGRTQVRIY
jgi:hypothetical protein